MNSEQKTNDISFDKVIEIVTNSLKKSAKETKDASTQTSNDECVVVVIDTDDTTTEQNEIDELLNECARISRFTRHIEQYNVLLQLYQ